LPPQTDLSQAPADRLQVGHRHRPVRVAPGQVAPVRGYRMQAGRWFRFRRQTDKGLVISLAVLRYPLVGSPGIDGCPQASSREQASRYSLQAPKHLTGSSIEECGV